MKICNKDCKYIEIIKDRPLRITMTKFRRSDHKLNIEKGRHKAMRREEGIVKLVKLKLLIVMSIYFWSVIYTAITLMNY